MENGGFGTHAIYDISSIPEEKSAILTERSVCEELVSRIVSSVTMTPVACLLFHPFPVREQETEEERKEKCLSLSEQTRRPHTLGHYDPLHLQVNGSEVELVLDSPVDLNSNLAGICVDSRSSQLSQLSSPGGYSAVQMLAESHISLHTFPACRAVSLDVFSCVKFDCEVLCRLIDDAFGEGAKIKYNLIARSF